MQLLLLSCSGFFVCEVYPFLYLRKYGIFRNFPIWNTISDKCVKYKITNTVFHHNFTQPLHSHFSAIEKHATRIYGEHIGRFNCTMFNAFDCCFCQRQKHIAFQITFTSSHSISGHEGLNLQTRNASLISSNRCTFSVRFLVRFTYAEYSSPIV